VLLRNQAAIEEAKNVTEERHFLGRTEHLGIILEEIGKQVSLVEKTTVSTPACASTHPGHPLAFESCRLPTFDRAAYTGEPYRSVPGGARTMALCRLGSRSLLAYGETIPHLQEAVGDKSS
jgi:hypothetical protein